MRDLRLGLFVIECFSVEFTLHEMRTEKRGTLKCDRMG